MIALLEPSLLSSSPHHLLSFSCLVFSPTSSPLFPIPACHQEMAEYLCPYWDTVCESYVRNIKAFMHKLRSENILIIHHLYNIRLVDSVSYCLQLLPE